MGGFGIINTRTQAHGRSAPNGSFELLKAMKTGKSFALIAIWKGCPQGEKPGKASPFRPYYKQRPRSKFPALLFYIVFAFQAIKPLLARKEPSINQDWFFFLLYEGNL